MFSVDVGCGDRKVDGAFGIDFRAVPGVDLVRDIATLVPEDLPELADVLYARHVLEHFPVRDTAAILGRWVVLVKPGGIVQIEVPRMDYIARHWFDRPDVEHQRALLTMAYGEQDYPGNFHQTLYSPELLRDDMQRAGLTDIQVVDMVQVAIGRGRRPFASI